MPNQSKIFDGYYILLCIDGSGSKEWRKKDGSNSYIQQFNDKFEGSNVFKNFLDGPSFHGLECGGIASEAINFINISLSKIKYLYGRFNSSEPTTHDNSFLAKTMSIYDDRKIRIVIVGHSRGGAIATYVASQLRFPVYFLGLYDAVNSSSTIPNTDVIKNVQYAYHAKRNLKRSRLDIMFNQTALSNVSGLYVDAEFSTSHGGIGGDPLASSLIPGFNDILVHPTALAISDLPYEVAATIQLSVLNLHFTPIFNTGITENLIRTESRKANDWMIQKAQLHGLTVL